MIRFLSFWRLLPALILLAAVAGLSGCMLVPHHGHDRGGPTEQTVGIHTGHETEATAPSTAEVATAENAHQGPGAMAMMHRSGRWGWFVGGAMVVMMALVAL